MMKKVISLNITNKVFITIAFSIFLVTSSAIVFNHNTQVFAQSTGAIRNFSSPLTPSSSGGGAATASPSLGNNTSSANGLSIGVSIAVDPKGNVFIADSASHKIQKFSPNKTWLKSWGTAGKGDGFFQGPMAITSDINGNIYVMDSGQNKVQVFDNNGKLTTSWSFNPNGSAPRGFAAPVGGPSGGGSTAATTTGPIGLTGTSTTTTPR